MEGPAIREAGGWSLSSDRSLEITYDDTWELDGGPDVADLVVPLVIPGFAVLGEGSEGLGEVSHRAGDVERCLLRRLVR